MPIYPLIAALLLCQTPHLNPAAFTPHSQNYRSPTIPLSPISPYSPSSLSSPMSPYTPRSQSQTQLFKKPHRKRKLDEEAAAAASAAIVLDDGSRNSGTTSAEVLPRNLYRTVKADRPTLGHVVPSEFKEVAKKIRREEERGRKQIQEGGSKGPKLRAQGKKRDTSSYNNPSNLRIMGGIAKNRRLISPDVYLRPMMGKVREALYSTLTSFGLYRAGARTRHLDIFAGSGSVGLESLSRGATGITFVDMAEDCCRSITENLRVCEFDPPTGGGANGRGNQIVCADAFRALENPASVGIEGTFQIVTLCPPYEEVVYADLVTAVANSPLVTDDTVVVLEYPVELGALPHVVRREDGKLLVGVRNRRYGRTVIAIYVVNPTGQLGDVATSRPMDFLALK
eukprot:CAMPEP_0194374084 /NCGR_PEP_ID=MMETSP0174-20130528/22451_1 /TAXON_ID=216777 /ORGANISM="Proboscia alata, Strain PI-D3" /LENGTH=396 /DNA_ID=CAMNT_0039153429 /DNA_START=169 /DNA_END=1359 /DNA_ORIENTATION=+